MQTVTHNVDGAPDKAKPYQLVNSDGSTASWFATHDEAVQAMNKTSKASRSFSEESVEHFLAPVAGFEFSAEGVWIEALAAKEYHTSEYGKVPVTIDKLNNLAASVRNKVRGIELSTDYVHGRDAAKGSKASGTINDAKVENNKLMLLYSPTDTAKAEIAAGEWKYFSSDWVDSYTHDDGTKHTDVLLGGGLTNRPVAKGLSKLPINFSEFFTETQISEGSDNVNELLKKLATELGIKFSETDDEGELSNKVFAEFTRLATENKSLLTEVEPLRKLKETADNSKSFAEQYPEQAEQMKQDREFRINANSHSFAETIGSKRFSENVGKKDSEGNDVVVTSNKGLSANALEAIRAAHLKFSEGDATSEDLTKVVDAIMTNGIVEYGEKGTSLSEGGTADTEGDVVVQGDALAKRLAFSEKVNAIRKRDGKDGVDLEFGEALAIAAKENPKMYEDYVGARSVA